MTTIQPEGENIRRATQWISEERQFTPQVRLKDLIEQACLKFDLSPMEAEFLTRTLQSSPPAT